MSPLQRQIFREQGNSPLAGRIAPNDDPKTFHDAFLNAAMLLGGMGPIHAPTTTGGKIFAGLYALYAGLFFLVIMGLLFAPELHRLLHRFHWERSSSNAVRQKTGPPNK